MDAARRRAKRSDAIANRERILDAAGAVIAEHGIDAPVHLIAKRAGVGIGTLYRNFPDRDALVLSLFEGAAADFDLVCNTAAVAPTGWDAVVLIIDGVTGVYRDRPWLRIIDVQVRRLHPFPMRWEATVLAAIERAWAEGSLRRDIEATDAIFVPTMLQALFELPEPVRETVIRRQRALLLDALRAEGVPRQPPDGDVPTVGEVRASLPGWPEGTAPQERTGAPALGDPRIHPRPRLKNGVVTVPLSGGFGTWEAFKQVHPPAPDTPIRQYAHPGRDWIYVTSGRMRLLFGDEDLIIETGEAAEFDTRVPHGFGNPGPDLLEVLCLFDAQGAKEHTRAWA